MTNTNINTKYIQRRPGTGPEHVLPFADQIGFHLVPANRPSPSLKKELVFNVSLSGGKHAFLSMIRVKKERGDGVTAGNRPYRVITEAGRHRVQGLSVTC